MRCEVRNEEADWPWDPSQRAAHDPFVPCFLTAEEMHRSQHEVVAKRYGKAETGSALPGLPKEGRTSWFERRTALELGFDTTRKHLFSDLWKGIRRRVLDRDRKRCRCGGRATQVHHRRYAKVDLSGLRFLHLAICRSCHEFGSKDGERITTPDGATPVPDRLVSRQCQGTEARPRRNLPGPSAGNPPGSGFPRRAASAAQEGNAKGRMQKRLRGRSNYRNYSAAWAKKSLTNGPSAPTRRRDMGRISHDRTGSGHREGRTK